MRSGEYESSIELYYEPAENLHRVQMIYVIAEDDSQDITEGTPISLEVAIAKTSLQALMMQSATAEMFYKATGTRKTFTLIEEPDGRPTVEILRLPRSRAALHAMNEQDLYFFIAEQLEVSNTKVLAMLGFGDYVDGVALGHTALGGGDLGIMGGLYLHTCPDSIEDIIPRFSNSDLIDTRFFFDDSGGRGTYWANCATGMGASLHELGHTFDHIFHTHTGIMERGFDNFNRLFVIQEPGFENPLTWTNEAGAVWAPASIAAFQGSNWFSN